IVSGARQRIVRDGAELVAKAIGARERAEHARHRAHRAGVDPADARMRMRRAHHRGIGLAVELEVGAEPAVAGDEAGVLVARDRLADEPVMRVGGLYGVIHGQVLSWRRGPGQARPGRCYTRSGRSPTCPWTTNASWPIGRPTCRSLTGRATASFMRSASVSAWIRWIGGSSRSST